MTLIVGDHCLMRLVETLQFGNEFSRVFDINT